jgi:23S rRNA pseudouridine1911/1915/1917 synthase
MVHATFDQYLLSLNLLLDDGHIIAVNKPAGLSTQSPPSFPSLEQEVRAHVAARYTGPGTAYLGVPHRLDRPVSGVILFAATPRAARKLARQFERRSIDKTYWAAVQGIVEPAAGTWRDLIRKVPDEARAEAVSPNLPGGQEAVLHYRTIGQTPFGSLLEITLETGRMHQIRLQASIHGHPVLGDVLYGSTIPFGPGVSDERERAIALHARSIEFHHSEPPQQRLKIDAPLPEYWDSLGCCT